MKSIPFLPYLMSLFLILNLLNIKAQTTVTIGTATTSKFNSPIYLNKDSKKYSESILLFTAAEIGTSGNFSAIAWDKKTAQGYTDANAILKIFVKHTDSSSVVTTSGTFASELISATQVYSSTIQSLPVAAGWMQFNFDQPFAYNGTDNLMVLLKWYRPNNLSATLKHNYHLANGLTATWAGNDSNSVSLQGGGTERANTQLFFSPILATDAGVAAITSPAATISPGTYPVKISLQNFGSDTLQSVNIQWSINGVAQTAFSWTGSILPFSLDTGIQIGSYAFTNGAYHLSANTILPNNQADMDSTNDVSSLNLICATPLNGTYTIGGAAADYPDFLSATADLVAAGISGPVIFNVSSGIYNEQIVLPEIVGTDSVNTITFQSASGLVSDVVLQDSATGSAANFTLKLSGGDYFRFKNLTIKALGSTYAWVLVFEGGASHNLIQNCIIISNEVAQNTSNAAGIYSSDGVDHGNHFIENEIWNGYYGIYFYGEYGGSGNEAGNSFIGNIIEQSYYSAITTYYQDAPIIRNNFINTYASTGIQYPVSLGYAAGAVEVSGNRIIINGSQSIFGLRFFNCTGTANEVIRVYNNMIHQVSSITASTYILYFLNSSYFEILYNTVSMQSSAVTGRAIYLTGCFEGNVMNNVFHNAGGGYSFYLSNSTNTFSDFNNYYTTGPSLAYWNSAIADLSGLQAASGQDMNTMSTDPLFQQSSDLLPTSSTMNNRALFMSSIAYDIDGNLRDSLQPDLGAFEYDPPSYDAAMLSIDTPLTLVDPGTYNLKVTIANYGLVDLTSLTIYYSLDGNVPDTFLWSGQLAAQSSLSNLYIDTIKFSYGNHNLAVWCAQPNGGVDANPTNDTLVSVINVCDLMSGSFSIGPVSSGANFNSFADAVDTLIQCGLGGPVYFSVLPGIYVEQFSIPEIPGSSATNQIAFYSSSGVSADVQVVYSPQGNQDWVIRLDGADYVSFMNMTIQVLPGSAGGKAIVLEGEANYNMLIGNNIAVPQTITGNYYGIYSENDRDQHNIISANKITGGYCGIYLMGESLVASFEEGNVIKDNLIQDFSSEGIYCLSQHELNIINNTMESSLSTIDLAGLRVHYSSGKIEITNNRFLLKGQEAVNGMVVINHSGNPADNSLIGNNVIHQVGPTNDNVAGLWIASSSDVSLLHNTIHLESAKISYGALYLSGSSNSSLIIANNSFSNEGGGRVITFANTAIVNGIDFMDHNNLFTSGNVFAYFGGGIADLSAWKTATSLDSNSITVDPAFYSPTLFYPTNLLLNASGTGLYTIAEDILGKPRDLVNPDLGAYEITLPVNDAGILSILNPPAGPIGAGYSIILVNLKNFGQDTLQSVNVFWEIDGVYGGNYQWSGSLAQFDTTGSIAIGNHVFTNGLHELKVWTESPNSYMDDFQWNDTASALLNVCNLFDTAYTIGHPGTGADFTSINQAFDAILSCGLGDEVILQILPGIYNEQISIPEIPGASAQNRLVLESYSGSPSDVIIQYAPVDSAKYVLRLDDADYISIRNLTLKVLPGATDGLALLVEGDASYNHIKNNVIHNLDTGSAKFCGIYAYETEAAHNVIDSNTILYGQTGIYWRGLSSSLLSEGNVFINNQISDFKGFGLYLWYQLSPLLQQNIILSQSNAANVYGARLRECDGATQISENLIRLSGVNTVYACELYQCDGYPGQSGRILNNIFDLNNINTINAYGLSIYYSGKHEVFYNTIRIASAGTGAALLVLSNHIGLSILNNMFTNEGGGSAVYFNMTNPTQCVDTMDYNNLFTSGGFLVQSTTAYAGLNDWMNASGFDSHSISQDPIFYGPFAVPVSPLVNGYATSIPGINYDFFGVVRNILHPDMGAVEFHPMAIDAELNSINSPGSGCDLGVEAVSILIRNNGDSLVNPGIGMHYQISGSTTVVSEYPSVSIPSGDSLLYTFQAALDMTVNQDSLFILNSWITLTGDMFPGNDSLSVALHSFVTPTAPLVADDTVFSGSSGVFQVINPGPGLHYFWTDDTIAGPLASGVSFSTAPLFDTTDFFVRAQRDSEPELIISEIFLGAKDKIEVQNVSGMAKDFTGWRIIISNSYFDINIANSISADVGVLSDGQVRVWTDGASDTNYWGNDIYWNTGTTYSFPGWACIIDNAGNLVDYVAWSWNATQIQGQGFNHSGVNVFPGQLWSGSGIPNPTSDYIVRAEYQNFSRFDWIVSNTGGIGTPNAPLQFTSGAGLNLCASPWSKFTAFVVPAPLQIQASADTAICAGDTAALWVSVSGGTSPYSYQWSPSAGISNQNVHNPMAFPSVSTNYKVMVTDASGSIDSAFVWLEVLPLPVVQFASLSPACIYASPFSLVGGTPSGGVYSGPGVSAGIFSPAAAGAGYHTLHYYYSDPITTCANQDTSVIFVDLCTGNHQVETNGFQIYPNPSDGEVYFVIASLLEDAKLTIMDIAGRNWYQDDIKASKQDTLYRAALNHLPPGLYLVSFNNHSHSVIRKLIIY